MRLPLLPHGRLPLVLAGLAVGCGDGGESLSPEPGPTIAAVTISPADTNLLVGQTLQLTAEVRDAQGHQVTGRPIAWSTSAPNVVSVSASGLASGASEGEATITATVGGKSGQAKIRCVPDTTPTPGYPGRIDLGTLGGNVSYANGINASGVVVGSAQTAAGTTFGFRWTLGGGMARLEPLPGDDGSAATGVDDQGTVLGVSFSGRYGYEGAVYHPVTWDAAGAVHPVALPFPVPAGFDTVTVPVLPNSHGQWAATASLREPPGCLGCDEATLFYSPETGLLNLRSLAAQSGVDPSVIGPSTYSHAVDINERGTVLGTGGAEDVWRPFLWNAAGGFRLPGQPPGTDPNNTRVLALDLNDGEEMVGWYLSSPVSGSGTGGPYRWSASDGFTLLSDPYGGGYASALNEAGDAVGVVWPDQSAAVEWPKSGGLRMLATAAGRASIALAINASGIAVGWEGSGSGLDNHAILWNTAQASAFQASRTRIPGVRSPSAATVRRCLERPATRTQRAVCLARPQ